MTPVYLEAVGLCAAGLPDWPAGRSVLRGDEPWRETPLPPFTSQRLPRNERRRLSGATRLALQVAEEAASGADACDVRTVFSTSGGDGHTIDRICQALLQPDQPVSPTQFHNSVHNCAAGYWAIATGCRRGSVSLSAHDGSFAAGLLEAAAATAEGGAVLLVTYEYPIPEPLYAARPFTTPFATALRVQAEHTPRSLALLRLAPVGPETEGPLADTGLERLRRDNPAARALPMLAAIADGTARRVVLPYLKDNALAVEIEPLEGGGPGR